MKMKMVWQILMLVCIGLTWISCGKDQEKKDMELIEEYLAENNLQAESTESGLYYIIHVPGSNEHPTILDDITFNYAGYLLNGNQFDAGENVTYPLSALIAGWQEGIPLFGKGGSGRLIIPSHLGYGDQAYPGIPANSVLIFDIELLDF